MKVYAYENKSEEIRKLSSSGGLFTTLATDVIKKGGIVYGAFFDDDWKVRHIGVDKIEDLSLLRKSKYVFSHLGDTLNEIKSHLAAKRNVMFTGTPCQVAAVKKYVGDTENRLLCVEVVCHGAPQESLWSRYLNEILLQLNRTKKDILSIDFRDKSNSWERYNFTINFKDGTIFTQLASSNIYMRLFLSDYILREGCFRCQFKYPNSHADITLGDLWGIKQLLPNADDRLGTSLVIIRTKNGAKAVEKIDFMKELSFDSVVTFNPALTTKALKPRKYQRFNKYMNKGMEIIPLGERILRPNFVIRGLRGVKNGIVKLIKR